LLSFYNKDVCLQYQQLFEHGTRLDYTMNFDTHTHSRWTPLIYGLSAY